MGASLFLDKPRDACGFVSDNWVFLSLVVSVAYLHHICFSSLPKSKSTLKCLDFSSYQIIKFTCRVFLNFMSCYNLSCCHCLTGNCHCQCIYALLSCSAVCVSTAFNGYIFLIPYYRSFACYKFVTYLLT